MRFAAYEQKKAYRMLIEERADVGFGTYAVQSEHRPHKTHSCMNI